MPDVITQSAPLTNDSPGVVQNVTATTAAAATNPVVWIVVAIVGILSVMFLTRNKKG